MENKSKIILDINENKFIRFAWIIFGFFMIMMGILGAILPVLPGTVFFILAALCFAKGSEKFYKMIIHNKLVGPHIQNYLEEKFIPIRTKIVAISFLWISVTLSSAFFIEIFWQRLIMFVIAISVTIYLILHKSKKDSN